MQFDRRTVVVCRSQSGQYYALGSLCPHQGASLCDGELTGTTISSEPGSYEYGRTGEILRCPWHGFEFDVVTGLSLHGEPKLRVRSYQIEIRDGSVFVIRPAG